MHGLAGEKAAVLGEWAAGFRAKAGREARVWFDMACIEQTKFLTPGAADEDLACLPIWLASCEELVMLVGPEYSARLWCLIELFTFLLMVAISNDNDDSAEVPCTVLPVVAHREAAASGRSHRTVLSGVNAAGRAHMNLAFGSFDVRRARCVSDEDTSRLLAVIASGWGRLDAFNAHVRRTLCEKGFIDDVALTVRASRTSRTGTHRSIRGWLSRNNSANTAAAQRTSRSSHGAAHSAPSDRHHTDNTSRRIAAVEDAA